MVKVVHLVNSLFAGGAERILANILENWNSDKYELQAWCLFEGGEITEELESKGIKVRVLNLAQKNRLQILFRLIHLFKKEKVKIIHCHHPFVHIWGRLAGILSGVKIIFVHRHGIVETNKYVKLKERFLNLFTSRTIAVSSFVKGFLIEQMGMSAKKIVIIYNGIDLQTFKTRVVKDNLSRNFITVCGISRLRPTKGFKYLLAAAPKVLEKFPDTRFLIVGDGPAKKDLVTYAEELGIDKNVEFSGTRMDIPAILSSVDIFVHPSMSEGLSLSIIEAQASGIPVVATEVGGTPEVVMDKASGILVPVDNADIIAESIIYLIENPEERIRMGENGRRITQEKFDINIIVKKIENLYEMYI